MPLTKPAKRTLLLLVVILIVGVGVWVIIRTQGDTTNDTVGGNTNVVVAGEATNEEKELFDIEEPQPKYASDDPLYADAKKRDEQRMKDIQSIVNALDKHLEAVDSYPELMDALVPRYIDALPADPTPDESEYHYTPIGRAPWNFYELSYTLEVGTDDIGPGYHTATPDGLVTL